jgi:hypothetical protein
MASLYSEFHVGVVMTGAAMFGVVLLRSTFGVRMLGVALLGISCPRRGNRRRDAGCRFAGIVFYFVPRLAAALLGTSCGQALGRSALFFCQNLFMASRGSSLLHSEFNVGVGTIGVLTLVVGLPGSCFVASQVSS